jgi:hypothetical protein
VPRTVHRLGPDVVEDHLVEILVELPALVPTHGVVDLGLGVDVERVGVDARERATYVEDVSGHRREAEQLALPEDRHRDRDVRRMGGAEVRVVVEDHVSLLDLALQPVEEAADVPGQRTDVHRSRVRLAQLTALGVEDARAEILRLPDDRGIGHAEQDARHLLGDRVEGAPEHSQGDRVYLDPLARRRSGRAPDFVRGH